MTETESYIEVFNYYCGNYPDGATKEQKRLIHKKSTSFQLNDGMLFFVGKNGKESESPQRWVHREDEQQRILHACHSERLAGHFGGGKTTEKVCESIHFFRSSVSFTTM